MPSQAKLPEPLKSLLELGVRMAMSERADAILLLLEGPIPWRMLRQVTGNTNIVIAADTADQVDGAAEHKFPAVLLDMADSPVYERLTQALLEAVADDLLAPGDEVVALYSGFEVGMIDSLSMIGLDERLGRLTVRDLRQLETQVPLDTLKTVVDLAVDIGREGREAKRVGTLFVVGDHRKVLAHCRAVGFDPFHGYNRKDRSLNDRRVREGVKETALMDGAFIIASDGTVEAGVQYVSAPAADITLSEGLGTRHWAAAAISRVTNAVAVAVSETTGTVRIFQNGEVMLRIEPLRRAMKWKDLEYEPTARDERGKRKGEGGRGKSESSEH